MVLLTWLIFVMGAGSGCCLRRLQVLVPSVRQAGDSATLRCRFDLEDDTLYSVKWYKGGKEFFRFVPKDKPPKQSFHVDGVKVNLNASDEYQVVLEGLSPQSSGRYKCEVSADHPYFQTVYDIGEMNVIVLPKDPATISGAQTSYRTDELITANCSLLRSKPAGNLSWFINGKQAPLDYIIKYSVRQDADGLESAILGLRFKAEERLFQNGGLRLSCVANLANSQWRTQFNITNSDIQLEFPRHRTLASRPAASTSGAAGKFANNCGLNIILMLVFCYHYM